MTQPVTEPKPEPTPVTVKSKKGVKKYDPLTGKKVK